MCIQVYLMRLVMKLPVHHFAIRKVYLITTAVCLCRITERMPVLALRCWCILGR